MICRKCGCGHMVDDSQYDIRVFRCWVCGERIYLDYPRRSGALVCSRCGGAMDTENALSLCAECLPLLGLHIERIKGRTYGQAVCACGTTFTRKSPMQLFHSKGCKRPATTAT